MNHKQIITELQSLEQYQYEDHPSRFICIFNIRKNEYDLNELKRIFEEYGEIKSINLKLIHFNLIIMEFYDIRSSKSALKYLKDRCYRGNKLTIVYGIPNEQVMNNGTIIIKNSNGIVPTQLPNDYLADLFGKYGEIKEIRESKMNKNNKFIEYFDIRSSENVMKHVDDIKYYDVKLFVEYSKPNLTKFQVINHTYTLLKFPEDMMIYIPPTYMLFIINKFYNFNVQENDFHYNNRNMKTPIEKQIHSINKSDSPSSPEHHQLEMIEFDNDGNIIEENREKKTVIIKNISQRCNYQIFIKFIENSISHFYSNAFLLRGDHDQTGVVIVDDYRVIETLYGYLHDKKIDDFQDETCQMYYSRYQNNDFMFHLEELLKY